jgi:hypothetical protein
LRLLVATPADRVEAERVVEERVVEERVVEEPVVEERGTGCTSEGMSAISIVLDTTLAYLCTLVSSQWALAFKSFRFLS